MRKARILLTLSELYKHNGRKMPGWRAVADAGIEEKDIYRHWEWLADAFVAAVGPTAKSATSRYQALLEEENKQEREEDPSGHYRFSVYVVRLKLTIGNRPWFERGNPNGTKACLYVGSTWHSPEDRLANHLRGHKASRRVAPFMLTLHEELTREHRERYMTRAEAERAEQAQAIDLRRDGYRVWQR